MKTNIYSIFVLCTVVTALSSEIRSVSSFSSSVSCFWDRNELCYLDCMSGPSSSLGVELENFWNQRYECHDAGLKLRIGSGITFPNFEMPAKWLTSNIRISELIIDYRNFDVISTDAFATSAFRTVENMTITFGAVKILQRGAFNGFDSLKSLVFQSSSIKGFSSGCLDSVASTLEYLELNELSSFSSPLLIDGLTGGAAMTALKTVKINHNLENTITERTFVGLISVTHLDLSSCKIKVIGANAFHPISNTIEELILNDNLLVTFTAGLFDQMLPRTGVRVLANRNLWNCDCELCYFKWLLVNANIFHQTASECRSPNYMRFAPVNSTDFCFDDNSCNLYVPIISTVQPEEETTIVTPEEATTTVTPEEATTTVTSEEEETIALETTTYDSNYTGFITTDVTDTTTEYVELFFSQKCYTDGTASSSETIFLRKNDYELKVMNIGGGKVVVVIEDFPANSVLIWYDSDGYNTIMKSRTCNDCSSDSINCRLCENSEKTQRVVIANLNINKAYVFCLLYKDLTSLRPLSCVPHIVMSVELDQNNIMYTGFVGYGTLSSILVVLIISSFMLRQIIQLKRQIEVRKCQLGEIQSSKC